MHPVFIILMLFIYLQFNPLKLHLNTIFRRTYLGITRAKLTFNVVYLNKVRFHEKLQFLLSFWYSKLQFFGKYDQFLVENSLIKRSSFKQGFKRML